MSYYRFGELILIAFFVFSFAAMATNEEIENSCHTHTSIPPIDHCNFLGDQVEFKGPHRIFLDFNSPSESYSPFDDLSERVQNLEDEVKRLMEMINPSPATQDAPQDTAQHRQP